MTFHVPRAFSWDFATQTPNILALFAAFALRFLTILVQFSAGRIRVHFEGDST
jgi:hypothetical protein